MKQFEALFKEKHIDYIQFHFTNLFGEFKAVEFPSSIWDDMTEGTGVDGSSLGFLNIEQSDIKILPDFSTLSVLPWNPRVARLICDISDNNGQPHSTCSRNVLKNVIQAAKSKGFTLLARPELEWYFMTKNFKPADKGTYMDMIPLDRYGELRRQITDQMIEMGIAIKTIHHETGPGQQEVEFMPQNPLMQADNVQTAKLIIKKISFNEDLIATFMPKPFEFEAGSGLHIHQYIEMGNVNNFTKGNDEISENLRFYIGGIQKHANGISAILNPITNSYKRLIPDHEAPVFNSWGLGNRTALIRVPAYERTPRVEYRAGDGAMNIYLAMALLFAAGLEGIENKIEPNNPTTKNVDNLTHLERETLGIKSLPRSLDEALDSFEKDDFFKKVLNKVLIQIYLNSKREEVKEYQLAKNAKKESEWEFNRYLMC
jgi:glutamine synthetase